MSETSETPNAASKESSGLKLPFNVSVTLRAGFVLALANVICAGILAFAWVQGKSEPKVISVTGSAKKVIASDKIVWSATISASDPDLSKAYDQLNRGMQRTSAYLKDAGIPAASVTVSSISTIRHMTRDEKGNFTDHISSYELKQSMELDSTDVPKVEQVQRKITELIKEGIMLESDSPRYFYTRLADLKIDMLAEATKDATTRARQIAANSGAALGPVRDARMGVMQINALNSDNSTGSGVNDTSSYMKEITAIVSAQFALK